MGLSKAEFLKGLKDIGFEEDAVPEKVETKPEAEPVKEPEPAKEEKVEAKVEEPAKDETVVAVEKKEETAPALNELFKGFSALDPDIQKDLTARWEAAEKAKADAEALKQRNHEFHLLQSRLAPTQRQLAAMQAEHAKLQNKLKEYEQSKLDPAIRARLDAFKADYPEQAEVIETYNKQTAREAEEARNEAKELRKRLDRFEQQQHIERELSQLSAVHDDWREAVGSKEFKVWRDSLQEHDPVMAEIIKDRLTSTSARDSIFVLNEFKRDLALARSQGREEPTPAPVATAKVVTPEVDPAPSTRQTAPSSKAGKPMSDKKREYIEAAEWLEKQSRKRA